MGRTLLLGHPQLDHQVRDQGAEDLVLAALEVGDHLLGRIA